MDTDLVLSALNKLTHSTPPVLLFIGLIALTYICRVAPIVPDRLIPRISLITAMVVYPLMAPAHPEEISYTMRFPIVGTMVRDELIALVVFSLAWAGHKYVLRWIEAKVSAKFTSRPADAALTPPDESGTNPP